MAEDTEVLKRFYGIINNIEDTDDREFLADMMDKFLNQEMELTSLKLRLDLLNKIRKLSR